MTKEIDTPADPGLRTLVQVALVVRDIQASSAKWAKVLGLPMPNIMVTDPGNEVKMSYRGKPSNAQAKLSFFHLGAVALELIEPIGDDSAWAEGLQKDGEGLHHLGFWVDDPKTLEARLEEQGMPMVHTGRLGDDSGSYGYFDSAPQLGVMLEYLHRDKPENVAPAND